MRLIAGALEPDSSGTATIDGYDTHPTAGRSAAARRPDRFHGLYLRLTARENVRYFGRLHGLNGKGWAAH